MRRRQRSWGTKSEGGLNDQDARTDEREVEGKREEEKRRTNPVKPSSGWLFSSVVTRG